MKVENKKTFILLAVFSVITLGVLLYPGLVDAVDITLSCGGSNQQCSGPCVAIGSQKKSFSEREGKNDRTLIHSAWRGGAFRWDDDASTNWSYSKPGYGGSWSDHSQNTGNRGWVCSCGDVDNCPGVSWKDFGFLSNGVTSLPGEDSINMSVNAINKHTASFNPVYGESNFGYAFETCGSGKRSNGPDYTACVNISGSINASPSSQTAPADISASWTSNSTSQAYAYLIKNGVHTDTRSSSGPNGSGTFTNQGEGNYQVCLNGRDGWGNEVNMTPQACVSFSIGPAAPPQWQNDIGANPSTIQVCSPNTTGSTTITASSNRNYRIQRVEPGGSQSWLTSIQSANWPNNRNHSASNIVHGTRFEIVDFSNNIQGSTGDTQYVYHTSSGCPVGPDVNIRANNSNGPVYLPADSTVNVSWLIDYAESCDWTSNPTVPGFNSSQTIADWQYPLSIPDGSKDVGPLSPGTYIFSLTCTNPHPNYSDSDSVYVIVNPPPQPNAIIRANGQDNSITIPYNSSVTISWTCENSDTGTVSPTGWTGITGSQNSGSLTSDRTYSVLCESEFGSDTDGVTVFVEEPTLSVNLTANPDEGNSPLNTTLQATTSGTATGTINYYFWWHCTNSTDTVWQAEQSCGVLPAPGPGSCTSNANGYRCNAVGSGSRSVDHTYSASATAKVIVERGAADPDEDRVEIEVLNAQPVVTFVNVTQPNYCSSGPAATVNWGYSDLEGTPQSAYQVQIDTTPGFPSPDVDSGKVSSSGTSWFGGLGTLQYNNNYYARVRVWDGADIASNWSTSSQWSTPQHAYPVVDFSFTPPNPGSNQEVEFTDETIFSDGEGDSDHSWTWLFRAPNPTPNSNQKNPTHIYGEAGSFNIQLTATDDDGFQCSLSQPINVQEPVPIFKEVAP